jgi:cyclopropane-fatty-acyl-phospholipid synthase
MTDELLRYFETTNLGWGRTTKHYAFTGIRARMGEAVVGL